MLTEENFKSLYVESFILNTSHSRRKRLKSASKTKIRFDNSFNAKMYVSRSGLTAKRFSEARYTPPLQRAMKKLITTIFIPFLKRNMTYQKDVERLLTSELFSPSWYASKYELVGSERELASHYLMTGFTMLYDPSPEFSTEYYLVKNFDVLMSDMNPLLHYILFGQAEKRSIKKAY